MNSNYQSTYDEPKTPYDQNFWDNYAIFLLKHNVSKKYITWYVLRTKQYIAAFEEISVRNHTHKEVESYISTKAQDTQLKKWQFTQIIDAIQILFYLGLKAEWAKDYDWDYLKTSAQPLSPNHPTVARDYSTALATLPVQAKPHDPAAKKRYEPVVAKVIKIIRLKNYSIRTEKTYVHWTYRFFFFHLPDNAKSLGAEDVSTTMIYTHVMNTPGVSVQSPSDLI